MIEILKKAQSVAFTGHRSIGKDRAQEVRDLVRTKVRLL